MTKSKKTNERIIEIRVTGDDTKIIAKGFSLIEILGLLRMYEKRITLELLKKIE